MFDAEESRVPTYISTLVLQATMKKFEFSSEQNPKPLTTFNGPLFYNVYKDSQFLKSYENIEKILSKAHELRHNLKNVVPGNFLVMEGMLLERNTPLAIKCTGNGVKVEDYEFTANRLTGIAAAYAYENRQSFPNIKSSEAASLGLTWDNSSQTKCKLYLSAVTGSEHFVDQFSYWPLVCAIKKLQLKKMPENLVIKVAKIKNNKGERLALVMLKNFNTAASIWSQFPNSKPTDLKSMLCVVSEDLKRLFKTD